MGPKKTMQQQGEEELSSPKTGTGLSRTGQTDFRLPTTQVALKAETTVHAPALTFNKQGKQVCSSSPRASVSTSLH